MTLTYPSDEIVQLLSEVGIKRTLEILLVMHQSPSKVKNPFGFIKAAIRNEWSAETPPQQIAHHRTGNDKSSQRKPLIPIIQGVESKPLPKERLETLRTIAKQLDEQRNNILR